MRGAATWTALLLAAVAVTAANAQSVEDCTAFTWDLTREFAAMRTPAELLPASADVRVNPVRLKEGKHFTATLLPQRSIGFVIAPSRPPKSPNPTGGLLFFRSGKAGIYRVSLTSRHWIDMLDGVKVIDSRAHQGHADCQLLHKVVEFELPANRELTLQLSGDDAATVGMVITAVPAK